MLLRLRKGDCLDILETLEDGSLGAFITDPPYDLTTGNGKGFMGKEWDGTGIAFSDEFWSLVNRKLMKGGFVKAFSGTRTFHRMGVAMERNGLMIPRKVPGGMEAWCYASGFPKSHNISKSLDRMAGAEREVIGTKRGVGGENLNDIVNGKEVRQTTDDGGKGVGAYGTGAKQVAIDVPITAPATEEAKLFGGYGTALKPAWEPVLVGYKL